MEWEWNPKPSDLESSTVHVSTWPHAPQVRAMFHMKNKVLKIDISKCCCDPLWAPMVEWLAG